MTIALGIGSNASLFGFARGLTPQPLPIPHIDRMASVYSQEAGAGLRPLSYDRFVSLKSQLDAFELLGAARESQSTVVFGRVTAIMAVATVTREIEGLLHLSLNDGVVISHRAWVRDFGARNSVRGETITIDGVETRVRDIAPEWLEGLYVGRPVDIWMPLELISLEESDRGSRTFAVLGRLQDGSSWRHAREQVKSARGSSGDLTVLPYTGATPELELGLARVTTLLLVAAGFVFLIACSNVASFLAARAAARWHETAVRVAIGAGRRRLVQQLLSDSALISVAGAAIGVVLATWTIDLVPAFLFDRDAEQLAFSPSLMVTIATSAVCVAITMVCGVIPLFEVRHDDPAAVLGRESGGPSTTMRRVRASLVIAQSAGCCLLIVSTGLLLDGFQTALKTYAGARLGQQILATVEASHRFEKRELGVDYLRRAGDAARSLPGISTMAWVGTIPGTRAAWRPMRIDPPPVAFRDVEMDVIRFTPALLEVITLPPIAGRMFGGSDSASCAVAVINQKAADELFAGDAVGRSIEDPQGRRVEVIGVVATRPTDASASDRPTVFFSELSGAPLGRVGPATFRLPIAAPAQAVLEVSVVSATYFTVMDLPVTAGATFGDDVESGCRVGVINEEAAELYFSGHAVDGAIIDSTGRRTNVIGVVRSPALKASQRAVEPALYVPMAQNFLPRMTLMLGTDEPGPFTLGAVRRRLDALPGGRTPIPVTTLDAHLTRTALAPERIAAVLVGFAAAIALALAALGLHGAMAEFVRQRQREIAVRLAIGASGWRVVTLVFKQGLQLAGIGTLAGMAVSLLMVRWLASLALTLGPPPVWPWLIAPLMAIGALVIASVPATRRALRVDPMTLLRKT